MKKKKINLITLGCSKNTVDSEKLLRQIQSGGYEIQHDSEDSDADTVIINTCGFINDAKEESIDTILRYVRKKEKGLIDNLYVIGCLSERYKEELKTQIPEVTRYFGVHDTPKILKELSVDFRNDLSEMRILTNPGHYAYLKISEGCDRHCAFCAIPLIRGRCISRTVEELIAEAENLAESGVKELILVAQDLSYYGLDLYKKQKLPDLVSGLLKIENLEWIRLHYLYPSGFPEELFSLMRNNRRICNYIDIPIQHITDRMLGIMRRSHDRRETESILNKIRTEIPGAAIRTTLIAGHPGETEEDFLELKKFVEDFRFDRLGIFAYSHEEDTYSYEHYKDEVPEDVKESRVSEIMELQQSISAGLNEKLVGQVIKVIIDRREGDNFIGRTEYDSPEIDQEVLIPAEYNITPGNFYSVMITQSSEFDLFGKPV
jgi:ribosomal protein S12 methylthiotransferase